MGSLLRWPVVYEKDNSVLNNCDWIRYSESDIDDIQYICGMRCIQETRNPRTQNFMSPQLLITGQQLLWMYMLTQ